MLSKIDYMGSKIEFNIDDCPRIRTNLGGFFTILIVIAFGFFLVYFGLDLIIRQNPNSIQSKNFSQAPVLNSTDMILLMAPMGPQFVPTFNIEKKFTLTLSIYEKNGQNVTTTVLPLVICDEIGFFDNDKYNLTSYLITPKEHYYCLPPNLDKTLIGGPSSDTVRYFNLILG